MFTVVYVNIAEGTIVITLIVNFNDEGMGPLYQ